MTGLDLGQQGGVVHDARQPLLDIEPQVADLLGRGRSRHHFAHGAPVDHAGGEIHPVMDDDRRHRAVLRQRNGGFPGDAGARRGGIDDKDHRLAMAFGDVDRRAHGAQVVRTGPGGHDHQIGMGHDAGNGLGDGGRGVDHCDLDAGLVQAFQRLFQIGQPSLDEIGRGQLARIPPMRQRALRVGIDQRDFARPGAAGLDRQMAGQGGLARPTFLGCADDGVHA